MKQGNLCDSITVASQQGHWNAGAHKAEANLLIASLEKEFMTSETYKWPGGPHAGWWFIRKCW